MTKTELLTQAENISERLIMQYQEYIELMEYVKLLEVQKLALVAKMAKDNDSEVSELLFLLVIQS